MLCLLQKMRFMYALFEFLWLLCKLEDSSRNKCEKMRRQLNAKMFKADFHADASQDVRDSWRLPGTFSLDNI